MEMRLVLVLLFLSRLSFQGGPTLHSIFCSIDLNNDNYCSHGLWLSKSLGCVILFTGVPKVKQLYSAHVFGHK